jgi:hypothetical protein
METVWTRGLAPQCRRRDALTAVSLTAVSVVAVSVVAGPVMAVSVTAVSVVAVPVMGVLVMTVSVMTVSVTTVSVMTVSVTTVSVTTGPVMTQRAGGCRSRSFRRCLLSSRGHPRRAAGARDRAAGQESVGICTAACRRRQGTARRPSTGLPRSGHCRSSCPTWAAVVSVEQFTCPGCGAGVAVMAAMWRPPSSIRVPSPPQPALLSRR